jgi:hypothetical protein
VLSSREQTIHDPRAGLHDRTELFAVHDLGDDGAAVPDEARDLLDGDAAVGQERHERVPQLSRRPLAGVDPTRLGNGCTEVAADIRRVQRGAVAGGEDESEVDPVRPRLGAHPGLQPAVLGQDVHAARRQCQSPARPLGLGVPRGSDGPPHGHRRRHGRLEVGPAKQVDVRPEQGAQLLRASTRQKGDDDVGLHPGPLDGLEDRGGLSQRE